VSTHHPLSIGVECDGPAVRLWLRGELDLSTAPTLSTCLESIDHRSKLVTVDMAAVTFLDSSGIAALVKHDSRFRAELRHLQIANPSERVLRVLELAGVAGSIDIVSVPSSAELTAPV
jgi:anti-sigma B factor antagonist